MDTEDARFLAAILADPSGVALQVVYADWMEERGDPRGAYLRLRCRLVSLSEGERPAEMLTRERELRAAGPPAWLAALDGPRWCVAANVLRERRAGHGGQELRRGTRHFRGGAKVYCAHPSWFPRAGRFLVLGRHRRSLRLIELVTATKYLTHFRAELVHEPAVLRRMAESVRWQGWTRGELERFVQGQAQPDSPP